MASSEEVEVYTTTAPERSHAEVGLLRARQASAASTAHMPQIIADLRGRAAEVGCDAITILGKDDKIKGTGTTGRVNQIEGYQANCLVFTDAAPAAPATSVAAPAVSVPPAASAASGPPPNATRDKAALAKLEQTRLLLSQGQQEKAEALAMGTVQACAEKCSRSVKAKLWILAGIARVRRDDRDGAQAAFSRAFAEDATVKLDDTVADDTARAVFFEARARLPPN